MREEVCRARDQDADACSASRRQKRREDAKKIMALETKLAEASRTRVELRDPQKNYNKMTQADLQKLMPDWDWAEYFKEINLGEPGDINVRSA